MISRLSAAAAVFAVLATSLIGWAASAATRRAETCEQTIVRLPTVEVTGKRAASAPALAQRSDQIVPMR